MNDYSGTSVSRCLIIANPIAGAVTEDLVAEVAATCAGHRVDVRVVWTRARGDATNAARAEAATPTDDGLGVIVSVGGDGTTLEVATGLVRPEPAAARLALFVVPAGTGNSNYRAYWDERPWRAALQQALTHPTCSLRRLDLARVVELDELVVLGAGAGLSAEVLRAAGQVTLRGRARLQAGLEHAARDFTPYPGRVIVDGVVVHEGDAVLVNVGGGRYRAWQYLVLPESVLDDGLLDVCVVGTEVAPPLVPELLRTGRHVRAPGAVYRRGRSVLIERTDGDPLCFEHDGELTAAEHTRLTLKILPGVLPVLCAPTTNGARRAVPGAHR